nr:hybrid signal transduction histidine kinase M [Tanacetum cinerariifolium]
MGNGNSSLCNFFGDQSIEAYFQKINSIVNILTSLEARVNDEDVVYYALEGLSDTYNQVCGYRDWKDIFLDLKTVRSLLITEEMRLKSKALALPVDSSSPMVLVAESEMRLKSKALALPVDSSSPMVLMAESGNNRRSSSSPQVKSLKPCFNFAKGMCRFGDSCHFMHDANAHVKGNQENDKIRSKPDKNGKRGEAEKSQKQLQ